MRGDAILKRLLYVIMVLFLFTIIPNNFVKAEKTGLIIIGDSRTVGMKDAMSNGSGQSVSDYDSSTDFFVCKSGKGYNWLKETGVSTAQNIIKTHNNISNWNIVISLGINDPDNLMNNDNYITYYNDQFKKDFEGCTLYITTIAPVRDGTNILADLSKCNDKLKGVTGAKVIDIYTTLKSSLKDSDIDQDGIHYTDDGSKKYFKAIKEGLGAGGTPTNGGSTGTSSSTAISIGEDFGTEDSIPGMDDGKIDWGGQEVTLPDGKDLTNNDKIAIKHWGDNTKSTFQVSILSFVRTIVALIGIVIVVYSLLLYLSYWLDRVNNFVEISFLGILTRNRLRLSPDINNSTFHDKNSNERTVIHKDMVIVLLIGLLIGVFILSGKLYTFIGFLMKTIGAIKDSIFNTIFSK